MIFFSRKKPIIHILSLVLMCAVCLAVTEISLLNASAELNQYNETAGTFDDFSEARIDSNIEERYGVSPYMQTSTFRKSGTTAEIETDSYVEWSTSSDVAFLYKRYDIGGTGSENVMTVETAITARKDINGGNDLFSTASGGLLITDSVTDPSAPRAFLHLRENGVAVVYRATRGSGMGVIYAPVSASLPINLKIVKSAKKYTCYYKGSNMNGYQSLGTIALEMTGPLYAGVAAHSSDTKKPIRAAFSGWYAVGEGYYNESESGGAESSSSGPSYPDTGYTDPAYDEEKTLLYETFSKGINLDGEDKVTPPVWETAHTTLVNTLDNGNRVWYIAQEDGNSYLGNQYWTDYTASLNFSFTDEMQAQDDDRFIFWVRRKCIENAGYFGYGIMISTDAEVDPNTATVTYKTKLTVVKQFAQKADAYSLTEASVNIDNLIGDGINHKLSVTALDNTLEIYLDEVHLLSYADTSNDGRVNLRGGIGVTAHSVDMTVDNILVEKVDDPNGGDWDNFVAGDYDSGMPQYVYDFYKEHSIKYFQNDSSAAIPQNP